MPKRAYPAAASSALARLALAGLALTGLTVLGGCNPSPGHDKPRQQAHELATVPLTIERRGANASTVALRVELARTAAQQERGLMFRRSVADDGGMIFPMSPPRTASFWMKDTLIPLDMLFIRTDGTIAMIADRTTPGSLTPVSAGIPVAAVLELRGGRAGELGLAVGDRVSWGACTTQPVSARIRVAQPDNFCPAP